MGAEVRVAMVFVEETCITCGISFLVTESFQSQRRRDGEDYFCPGGHAQHFIIDEKSEPSAAPGDRGELIRALHRAEQLEAELEAVKANTAGETPAPQEPEKTFSLSERYVRIVGDRMQCVSCGKRYATTLMLFRHLERAHKVSDSGVRGEIMEAWQKIHSDDR